MTFFISVSMVLIVFAISSDRILMDIVFSDNPLALRSLSLFYGLTPTYMSKPEDTAEFIRAVDATLRETGWADVGDPVVVVVGEPIGQADYTNSIRIHTVRES